MTEHPSYRIRTLKDLLAVPVEDRARCLRDLEYGLVMVELAFGADTVPDDFEITWVDDGAHDVTVMVNGKVEAVLTATEEGDGHEET